MLRSSFRLLADLRTAAQHRLFGAALALLFVVLGGTLGYRYIGDGEWSLADCLYMTIITLSTVGFQEVLPGLREHAFGREFTLMLIVFGSGSLLYFVSNLTAFIVEGQFRGALRRNRMRQAIEALADHVIVCGIGTTGEHVVRELVAAKQSFVAIEGNEERIERVFEDLGEFPCVRGDATDDQVLEDAGIARARGVVTTLHDDKDNLFVVVTARALNARARIVSRAVEASSMAKLRRGGADAVVSPNFMGGIRLVNELIRPHVVELFDELIREGGETLRLEEVHVPAESPFAGVALRRAGLREMADALVIAVRRADGSFLFNPPADFQIEADTTLIVLARAQDVTRLRAGMVSGELPSGGPSMRPAGS